MTEQELNDCLERAMEYDEAAMLDIVRLVKEVRWLQQANEALRKTFMGGGN